MTEKLASYISPLASYTTHIQIHVFIIILADYL